MPRSSPPFRAPQHDASMRGNLHTSGALVLSKDDCQLYCKMKRGSSAPAFQTHSKGFEVFGRCLSRDLQECIVLSLSRLCLRAFDVRRLTDIVTILMFRSWHKTNLNRVCSETCSSSRRDQKSKLDRPLLPLPLTHQRFALGRSKQLTIKASGNYFTVAI